MGSLSPVTDARVQGLERADRDGDRRSHGHRFRAGSRHGEAILRQRGAHVHHVMVNGDGSARRFHRLPAAEASYLLSFASINTSSDSSVIP